MSTTNKVRVLWEKEKDFCLIVKDGRIAFARVLITDENQAWHKDEKYGEGKKAFALVHKNTRLAMKIAPQGYPVKLVSFDPKVKDDNLLWTTESVGNSVNTHVKEYLRPGLVLSGKDGIVHSVDIDKYAVTVPQQVWELQAFEE